MISDTHLPAQIRSLDQLGPACADFFAGVDLILHGGDIVLPAVLDWLEQFAPVLAAQGNNDHFDDPRMLPEQYLELHGWRIGMAHILTPENRPLPAIQARCFDRPLDIMIGGHTHRELIRHDDGMLLVNSGSAVLPHHKQTRLGSVGLLEISADEVLAEIRLLGESNGLPNPCRPLSLALQRDGAVLAPPA